MRIKNLKMYSKYKNNMSVINVQTLFTNTINVKITDKIILKL